MPQRQLTAEQRARQERIAALEQELGLKSFKTPQDVLHWGTLGPDKPLTCATVQRVSPQADKLFPADWANLGQVVRYAGALGSGVVVLKHADRKHYNITAADRVLPADCVVFLRT